MPDLAVWPTDGADGSVSSEARWRKMARMWVPSGVDVSALAVAGGLAPTLVAGPTINVAAGGCWLDGHYAEIATPSSVAATANGILVVRFTPADNHAELLWRDAATVPTQTVVTWELLIASMAAGVLTDRRTYARVEPVQSERVIVVWDYPTLKALYPTPGEGQQAVTAVDGKSWTFRGSAYGFPAPIGTAPANRWEATFNQIMTTMATDANGIGSIPASAFGLDAIISCVMNAGWSASAAPNTYLFGTIRPSSATLWQMRMHMAATAFPSTVGLAASKNDISGMFSVYGWKV